jgi:outer membrane protein TolC
MPLVRPEDVEVDLHWGLAVQTAMARPDIASQRAAIRATGLALAQARNGMLPNVSLQADYAVTGLEEAFGDSLATIGRHEFNRWGVGLYYERPIGMRSAKATVRQAQLQLARENARLRKLEHDIVHQLRQAYDSVRTANAIWLQQQQHVRLLEEQIQVYTELHREGEVELFRLLDVQTDLVDAQIQANAAWTTARLAEARWRYEKSEDLAFYNLHLAP